MQQVKITDLRANLPEFLKKVAKGEEIQITFHGNPIARIIPEVNAIQQAQLRLDNLKGSMITGDIMSTIEDEWTADADNL
ncbi:MAG: type II toxin-antitoxin system prevent-host-death family antitoxin [Proteobacteria bacterium]|nr:type II toxin-antitoxin system prevent-host-death family antitoxin [Pseudomonadota bacterium]